MPDTPDYIPPGQPTPAERRKSRAERWPEHRVIRFHRGEAVEIVDLSPAEMQYWEIFRGAVGIVKTVRRAKQWASKSRETKTRRPRVTRKPPK